MGRPELDILPLLPVTAESCEPLLIAGPCSAESEEQVMEVALRLAKIPCVKAFRAGVWKPRTMRDPFEGVGSKALPWLRRVKEETGLLTCIEVATPKHLEEALKAGIDIFWIGARTTGNPFSVQELADGMRGLDIPVMVKNPLTPDLKLWIGALERIHHAGIRRLAAVHRGFSTFERGAYRYPPLWDLPIELRRLFPNLQVICDPSHIAGDAALIASLSQKAVELDMAGLMIEVHPNPSAALTDARQQLTLDGFEALIRQLHFLRSRNEDGEERLLQLRQRIDMIDHELLSLLADRQNVVEEMGRWKHEHHITILQSDRWREIFEDRLRRSRNLGLSRDFVVKMLQEIHRESIRVQERIYKEL